MPPKARKPPPPQELSQAEIITIIAGALALEKAPRPTAETLAPLIGVPVGVLTAVLIIAMSRPIRYGVTVIPSATASAESQALEPHYRALYVWNAVQRLLGGGDLAAEKRYFNQHMEAVAKRRKSASAVDKARARYGDELGWHARMDSRTSPECREANGKNFSATRIPAIGFPGGVHPNCRCRAGRKFATSETVYKIQMRVAA